LWELLDRPKASVPFSLGPGDRYLHSLVLCARTSVNQRTDGYGGSPENRCRLLREIIETLLSVWPLSKVGVRLSPHDAPNGGNTHYGCEDSNPDLVNPYTVRTLDGYDLEYLLLTEPRWIGKHNASPEADPGFQMH
jgi:2,4-dienoyl-CoA reductase-like NADH-dependent reductase (Old Yellow Enzyme family)